jgi:hypothetical protein
MGVAGDILQTIFLALATIWVWAFGEAVIADIRAWLDIRALRKLVPAEQYAQEQDERTERKLIVNEHYGEVA